MSGIVLLDNQDSFVYNLVDALRDFDATVYRNTVPASRVLDAEPDLIVLSPGPGYPADAGSMMELIDAAQGRIPVLGICLGFQALVEHFGGRVQPCGPVHGASISMELEPAGINSGLFSGLTTDDSPGADGHRVPRVPVARYHSLGTVDMPVGMHSLARTDTQLGRVVMAARSDDYKSIGLQFHPESILTPAGPLIIERCVAELMKGR
ncbi:gamma-glutamyl-gamma-aminobutyrate hydrolase family protein [Corynebacterium qintianiae]|uniref:anthranilate synthase n=1 Tax=Corynebacterium qintianiae TaxID=2709392 RepID=A0A7T0KMB2_9CORY|nr:gamma-glutamyl-gamma-aminobutyrate hydrolase family protein [Corynebacterium qintianiae]QPK83240.1 gamma-glutamyl-gamma-aminobutyrate hydrolase family protein [Corynebacterium qintianiae]